MIDHNQTYVVSGRECADNDKVITMHLKLSLAQILAFQMSLMSGYILLFAKKLLDENLLLL
ncbi:MAG: hypothetical protein MRQ09_03630 [Candidatus Midichloria sp.]|nr:hypothetical protein [Candidatus Midichloria sp.]